MRTLIAGLILAGALPGADVQHESVLWRQPGSITINDWIWGVGGEARFPKPPFEFMEEDLKGSNPKIRVRDAKGDRWTVKFGGEDHTDVFASRMLFAIGYTSQASYFVPSGVIVGAHDLKRARVFLGRNGEFSYARFKLHDSKRMAHVDELSWSWADNPFVGTHELNGLKILMMLMANWDAKDSRDGEGSNTAVYAERGSSNRLYAVDDWGATFGKWGGFFSRDKWNAAGFKQQTRDFVRSGEGSTLHWGYRGKHDRDITSGINIEDVRWLVTYLNNVTDEQLRAGLQASGATAGEVDLYTWSIRERIGQLQRLAADSKSTR